MEKQYTNRLKPYEGESLSSFILRFAIANGLSFLTFWNSLKKIKKERLSENHYAQMSSIYYLNYLPLNTIDFSKCTKATRLNDEKLYSMTFYNVLKKFSINDNLERARFIFGMIQNKSFYYCPYCLKEKAYNRLIWSIKDITVCPIHKTYLQNICPACGKNLMLKEIYNINLCPHCGKKLSVCIDSRQIDDEKLTEQLWLYEAWQNLFETADVKYEPRTIALKTLFLLNDQNPGYDRETVSRNIPDSAILETLLQHARGTLVQKRMMHLAFIFNVLIKLKVSFDTFLNLGVPEIFIKSLKDNRIEKEEPCCKAPWCENNNKPDSLIKIATSYMRKHTGDYKSFYFICPKCGCEYTYESNGILIERTNLIKGYEIIKQIHSENMGLKELCNKSGLKRDKLRRLIAYFYSNNILKPIRIFRNKKLDIDLLNRFIEDIKHGENVQNIRYKNYWTNYLQFLIHRYNNKVIQIIAQEHLERHLNVNVGDKQAELKSVLSEMLQNGVIITINNVCLKLGVDHETLRNWNCLNIISEAKRLQRSEHKVCNVVY